LFPHQPDPALPFQGDVIVYWGFLFKLGLLIRKLKNNKYQKGNGQVFEGKIQADSGLRD
jgi:hypothetical protein